MTFLLPSSLYSSTDREGDHITITLVCSAHKRNCHASGFLFPFPLPVPTFPVLEIQEKVHLTLLSSTLSHNQHHLRQRGNQCIGNRARMKLKRRLWMDVNTLRISESVVVRAGRDVIGAEPPSPSFSSLLLSPSLSPHLEKIMNVEMFSNYARRPNERRLLSDKKAASIPLPTPPHPDWSLPLLPSLILPKQQLPEN